MLTPLRRCQPVLAASRRQTINTTTVSTTRRGIKATTATTTTNAFSKNNKLINTTSLNSLGSRSMQIRWCASSASTSTAASSSPPSSNHHDHQSTNDGGNGSNRRLFWLGAGVTTVTLSAVGWWLYTEVVPDLMRYLEQRSLAKLEEDSERLVPPPARYTPMFLSGREPIADLVGYAIHGTHFHSHSDDDANTDQDGEGGGGSEAGGGASGGLRVPDSLTVQARPKGTTTPYERPDDPTSLNDTSSRQNTTSTSQLAASEEKTQQALSKNKNQHHHHHDSLSGRVVNYFSEKSQRWRFSVLVAWRFTLFAVRAVPVAWYFFLALALRTCPLSVCYEQLRELFTTMGPSFIKLGQWVATRPDIFPTEMCETLSRLYDDAPAHSAHLTIAALKRGGIEVVPSGTYATAAEIQAQPVIPGRVVLTDLDLKPLNSGSMAQVHKARLALPYALPAARAADPGTIAATLGIDAAMDMANSGFFEEQQKKIDAGEQQQPVVVCPAGMPVVVKALHPDVRRVLVADLSVLKATISILSTLIPSTSYLGLGKALDEFSALMVSQLDLLREGENLLRFRYNFRHMPQVVFPMPILNDFNPLNDKYKQKREEKSKKIKNENEKVSEIEKDLPPCTAAREVLIESFVYGVSISSKSLSQHSQGAGTEKEEAAEGKTGATDNDTNEKKTTIAAATSTQKSGDSGGLTTQSLNAVASLFSSSQNSSSASGSDSSTSTTGNNHPSGGGTEAVEGVEEEEDECDDVAFQKKIGMVACHAILKMLFRDNYVHADAHPGNVLVRIRHPDGRLTLPGEPLSPSSQQAIANSLGFPQSQPLTKEQEDEQQQIDLATTVSGESSNKSSRAYDCQCDGMVEVERTPSESEGSSSAIQTAAKKLTRYFSLEKGLPDGSSSGDTGAGGSENGGGHNHNALEGGAELQVVFLDTGLVTSLSPTERDNFLALFASVACGDSDLAGQLMLDRSPDKEQCTDPQKFIAKMREVFSVVDTSSSLKGISLGEISIGELLAAILNAHREFKVRIDMNFASLVGTLVVAEGIGRRFFGDYNIVGDSVPFLVHCLQSHELAFLVKRLQEMYLTSPTL